MSTPNPYQSPETVALVPAVAVEGAKYHRVGGWLYLLASSLISTIALSAWALATTYWPIFRDGDWHVLTDPASGAYHPLWAPVLLVEVIANVLLPILAGVVLVLLFRRSRLFPRFMLVLLGCRLLFLLVDQGAASQIPAVATQPGGNLSELTQGIVYVVVWTSYVLRSERVKQTFVC